MRDKKNNFKSILKEHGLNAYSFLMLYDEWSRLSYTDRYNLLKEEREENSND